MGTSLQFKTRLLVFLNLLPYGSPHKPQKQFWKCWWNDTVFPKDRIHIITFDTLDWVVVDPCGNGNIMWAFMKCLLCAASTYWFFNLYVFTLKAIIPISLGYVFTHVPNSFMPRLVTNWGLSKIDVLPLNTIYWIYSDKLLYFI